MVTARMAVCPCDPGQYFPDLVEQDDSLCVTGGKFKMNEEKTQLSQDAFDELHEKSASNINLKNPGPELTDEQQKSPEESFRELVEKLGSSALPITIPSSIIDEQKIDAICKKTECHRCGFLLGNTLQKGSYPGYVTCPNCSYIQYIDYRCHCGYLSYIVVDQYGKKVLGYNGLVRLFESEYLAKEYIRYCEMDEKCEVHPIHIIY